mmetsp:Transcript_33491/g.41339  ORF Transcript_33491/g.41339 Transcript_33491/m.41339 type:complete len:115 (+) Transcript_33491:745-1089(+)
MFVLILFGAKDLIFNLYTSSDEMKAELERVWPVILIYAFFDVLQTIASGGIRAAGKQSRAALVTWLGYAVFSVLASWLCAFKFEMGLLGLWIGPTVAVTFLFFAYLVIWMCIDW